MSNLSNGSTEIKIRKHEEEGGFTVFSLVKPPVADLRAKLQGVRIPCG